MNSTFENGTHRRKHCQPRGPARLRGALLGSTFAILLFVQPGCADQPKLEPPSPAHTDAVDDLITPSAQPRATEEETSRSYGEFQEQLRRLLSRGDPELAAVETITSGDFEVATVPGLMEALSTAQSGQTIFVDGSARLDLTGFDRIQIPDHVCLASSRGIQGSSGALLYTSDMGATLFEVGEGASLIGLNLMGPDPERRGYQIQWLFEEEGGDAVYRIPTSVGVEVSRNDVRIENCEIWAWSRAGIAFQLGSRGGVVRHNFLHHNRRRGLGYGVSIDAAEVLVESNLFDWCRHAVASTGRPGSGYEARYNFILQNANGHSFDMHGGADRGDSSNVAGSWAKIHHNIVVQTTHPGVFIRGIPLGRIEIHTNKFEIEDPDFAIKLKAPSDRIVISGNEFAVKIMQ